MKHLTVEKVIQIRQSRRHHFPSWLFGGEEAWDLLLELYRARLVGAHVSKVAFMANVAGRSTCTTTRRWLNALERSGLVVRRINGAGTEIVMLSDESVRAMANFFDSLPQDESAG